MKTSELTGAALDWAVAKCENFYTDGFSIIRVWNNRVTKIIPGDYETREVYTSYSPSTDWAQGGPIVASEKMSINYDTDYEYDPKYKRGERWVATHPTMCLAFGRGTTPLIAAMRCYVASKLGDEVEIPEELK